jgi:hypothetical protein
MRGSNKKFIECDGFIRGATLSQLAAIGGIFGSIKAKEEWVPRKIYFKAADIGEMTYYPEDRKLVEKAPPRAPRIRGMAEMLAGLGGMGGLGGPAGAPANEQGEEEEEAPPQDIITYAPAGWYFCPDWTKTEYHIARDADAVQLANSSADSDVARALHRLADEIALKPSSIPGSEFLEVQTSWNEKMGNRSFE